MTATILSSSDAVRHALSDRDFVRPQREVDPETGELKIHASTDVLMQWMPSMSWDLVALWSRIPIYRAKLYYDRRTCVEHSRAYVEHDFPDGEDLETAIVWWRKRVGQAQRGVAVFEGGFDVHGPVDLTDPPRVMIDSEMGDVVGDGEPEIEAKRAAHGKRKAMSAKWASKGVSDELQRKIENAERLAKEKKSQGQEYMLKGGWVNRTEVANHLGKDLDRHNEIHKQFG